MGVLDFIFALLVLIVVSFIAISYIALKYNTIELEKENDKLRTDLVKARQRKKKEVNK